MSKLPGKLILHQLLHRIRRDRAQTVTRSCLASSVKGCGKADPDCTDRWYAQARYANAFSALETFATSMRVRNRARTCLFARSTTASTAGSTHISSTCILLSQPGSWLLESKRSTGTGWTNVAMHANSVVRTRLMLRLAGALCQEFSMEDMYCTFACVAFAALSGRHGSASWYHNPFGNTVPFLPSGQAFSPLVCSRRLRVIL